MALRVCVLPVRQLRSKEELEPSRSELPHEKVLPQGHREFPPVGE